MAHSQRALQGIVRESKDMSVNSSDGKDAVQSVVIPLPVPTIKARDLVSAKSGWGNFYLIKGPEDVAMDKKNQKNDDSKGSY